MIKSAFELGEHLKLRELTFNASPLLWEKWDIKNFDLNFDNWTKIKYLNQTSDDFHIDINKVPNDKGGLYLFFINCKTISGITELPLYIGRAQLTKGQNLRKRVKEYYSKYVKNDERSRITKMFNYWSNEIHLAFFELDSNIEVVDLEKKLINSLLLPMNDQVPDIEIRQAKKAF
jgi:hypothetical protein